MSDQTLHKALSKWLFDQLEHGIKLTDDVLDYVDATFGTRDLSVVLKEEDAGEIDSLLELLFYPDEEMQLRFEAQWGRQVFTEKDLDAALGLLCAASPVAHIIGEETGSEISLSIPTFARSTFVQRLNICRQIPGKLAHVLDTRYKDDTALWVRVQLRNARLPWSDDQVDLTQLYLTQIPPAAKAFESDLVFLISILPELPPQSDAYAFLIGKKFFYFQSLCSAEDFERKRLSSNMEIMMLSGARSAHGSIEDWRRCMRTVDRICQGLFGRTQFFQQPDSQNIDLQGGLNIQDVVRKLS